MTRATPELRRQICKAPAGPIPAAGLIEVWSRFGLWREGADRAVLLQLPYQVSQICDLWDRVQADQAKRRRQHEAVRELSKKLLGGR